MRLHPDNDPENINPHPHPIPPGSVTLINTIVANNLAPIEPNNPNNPELESNDCAGDGEITSGGNNILGTGNGCTITFQATDFIGDPLLQNLRIV